MGSYCLFAHTPPNISPFHPMLVLQGFFLPNFGFLLLGCQSLYSFIQNESIKIVNPKEYARAEGVSAGFGVDSESVSDLARGIGVSETAEYWEKVQRISARPHVDLIPGRNGTGTCLTSADT